jgi:uncharacterized protein with GYD domain
MAKYLFEVAYTSAAWAAQLAHPSNRIEAVAPALESLGGRFETAYFAFGGTDLIGIIEVPDNTDAAAFSLAVNAGGAVKFFRTTPLLEIEEGIAAMGKAQRLAYRAPGR